MSVKDKNNLVLVVEDDIGIRNQLQWCFDDYEVILAGHREEAIDQIRLHSPPIVLLDLGLPPDPGGITEGLATLTEIFELAPNTKVIVITGNDDKDNAVKTIGAGAYDHYQKPIDRDELTLVVDRAHRIYTLERENESLLDVYNDSPLKGIIATSPQMLKVCKDIEKIAPSNVSTLLLGDSGTGKELLARALHDLSPRASESMVAINCAAIPAELLESELFGYEKGAFTGAAKQTPGKIENADKGTLFLDEIGDLPMSLQAKLLRFLQERTFERVGGRTEIPVDIRVITATHKNLAKEISEGLFREDLFYRISEITISVPALKDREGDVLTLSKAFLTRFTNEHSKASKSFSDSAVRALECHDWPGNIRELENRIKRAVIMSEDRVISSEDLELIDNGAESTALNLKEARNVAERQAVVQALIRTEKNISKAAKLLGITRPTLYDILDKHKIRRPK